MNEVLEDHPKTLTEQALRVAKAGGLVALVAFGATFAVAGAIAYTELKREDQANQLALAQLQAGQQG